MGFDLIVFVWICPTAAFAWWCWSVAGMIASHVLLAPSLSGVHLSTRALSLAAALDGGATAGEDGGDVITVEVEVCVHCFPAVLVSVS
jgi:hypothetical protein